MSNVPPLVSNKTTFESLKLRTKRDALVLKASHMNQSKNRHKHWNRVEALITQIEDLNKQIEKLENGENNTEK